MALPSLDDITLPLLQVLNDGKERRVRDAAKALEQVFNLTEEDLRQTVSGGEQKFLNRVWWARTHLVKAGLVMSPKRGHIRITDAGRAILKNPTERLSAKFLAQQSTDFADFFYGSKEKGGGSGPTPVIEPIDDGLTPIERMDQAVGQLRSALRDDLLKQIHTCSPEFFEHLVLNVLVAMGYGGNFQDSGQVVGGPGDKGVDGIINEDRLGLDKIYLQAKRWVEKVSGSEIQKFIGALQMRNARKGVFITTSDFTHSARDAVANLAFAVVLLNGNQLAELMIEYKVGVAVEQSFEVCRMDMDYFGEEE